MVAVPCRRAIPTSIPPAKRRRTGRQTYRYVTTSHAVTTETSPFFAMKSSTRSTPIPITSVLTSQPASSRYTSNAMSVKALTLPCLSIRLRLGTPTCPCSLPTIVEEPELEPPKLIPDVDLDLGSDLPILLSPTNDGYSRDFSSALSSVETPSGDVGGFFGGLEPTNDDES